MNTHTHTHLQVHKTDSATPRKLYPPICVVTLKALQDYCSQEKNTKVQAQSMNVKWQTPSLFSSNAQNQSLSLPMETTLTQIVFLIQYNRTWKDNQLVKGCQKQLCRVSASVFTLPVLFLLILHTGNDYLSQKQSPKQTQKTAFGLCFYKAKGQQNIIPTFIHIPSQFQIKVIFIDENDEEEKIHEKINILKQKQ